MSSVLRSSTELGFASGENLGADVDRRLVSRANVARPILDAPTPPPASRVTRKNSACDVSAGGSLRVRRIWGEWLQALAADPEAALAAALAYRELDCAGREEWLAALDSDLVHVGVSNVAVYAPLLAVEEDGGRRARIARALNKKGGGTASQPEREGVQALQARGPDGSRIAVIARPLYLDFVQVLACGYVPGRCFLWVRHDPIASQSQALAAGEKIDDLALEDVPSKALVDELAQTVVAHTRQGGELPEALRLFADLFGPSASEYPPPMEG